MTPKKKPPKKPAAEDLQATATLPGPFTYEELVALARANDPPTLEMELDEESDADDTDETSS